MDDLKRFGLCLGVIFIWFVLTYGFGHIWSSVLGIPLVPPAHCDMPSVSERLHESMPTVLAVFSSTLSLGGVLAYLDREAGSA